MRPRRFRFGPGFRSRSRRFPRTRPRHRHRSSSTSAARRVGCRKGRWRERGLRRIKTIRHVVGGVEPRINRRNAEQSLAEFQQADMGALRLGNKSLPCIGADYETWNARAVTKLLAIEFRMRVPGVLCTFAVPFLNVWRHHMVIPSAPIVPSDEDDRARPQFAVHDGFNLLPGPFRALCDVLAGMFAVRRIAVSLDPGNRWQLA